MQAQRRADLAYVAGLILGGLFMVMLGGLQRRIELVHINDFSGVWAGARAVVLGIDPYDPARWRDATIGFGSQVPDTAVYGYFPWVLLGLAPFGLLSVETAGWLWMFLGVAVTAIALRLLLGAYVPGRAFEHGLFGLALLVTQPGFHALILGQWALLLLGAVAAGVLALRADRAVRAGVLGLAFLLKPQLFVFTAIRFFTHRRIALVGLELGPLSSGCRPRSFRTGSRPGSPMSARSGSCCRRSSMRSRSPAIAKASPPPSRCSCSS